MRQVSMGNPDITSRYLRDVRKLETINGDEQKALLKKYSETEDERTRSDIRAKLMLANQAFIISMARHLATEDDFNDLISEGNLGLVRAIDAFDLDKDSSFLTCASFWIRKAMTDYQNEVKRPIKPRNAAKVYAYKEKAQSKFFSEHGRFPSADELQDELLSNGIAFANKEDLYDISVSSINSNSKKDGEEEEFEWFDNYCYQRSDYDNDSFDTERNVEAMTASQMVRMSLSYLSENERRIVCQYYGIGCEAMTTYQIAQENGIDAKNCDVSVKRKINRCINKIRKNGKIQTEVQ